MSERDELLAELARELGAPALFDEGVEATRNAAVAGASLASAVITAAAWYDNPLTGVPALVECLAALDAQPRTIAEFCAAFAPRTNELSQDSGYSPGFGFVGAVQAAAVHAACARLARSSASHAARLYLEGEAAIREAVGPLNQCGLAALFLHASGCETQAAQRWFLLQRVDTALREAQAAAARGLGAFPFFSEQYVYEGALPASRALDLDALARSMGLE